MVDGSSTLGRRTGWLRKRIPLSVPGPLLVAEAAGSLPRPVDGGAVSVGRPTRLRAAELIPLGQVSPALALLAPVTFIEGYRWLHVLPADRAELASAAFVVVALLMTMSFTRAHRSQLRPWTRRLVAVALAVTTVATLAMFLGSRPATDRILGLSDLLVGTAVVAAVVLSALRERGSRPSRGTRTAPGGSVASHAGVVQRQNISFPS